MSGNPVPIWTKPDNKDDTVEFSANVLQLLLDTAVLMLLLGAIHADVFTPVPPLGFTQTLLVVLTLRFAGRQFTDTTKVNGLYRGIKATTERGSE